jgi:tetratricopeptide (TPR) repeat protein
MRDSLNLAELKEQAKAFRRTYEWYKQFGRMLLLIIVLIFVVSLFPPANTPTSIPLLIVELVVAGVLFIVTLVATLILIREYMLSARRNANRIQRVNTYAPPFVPRLNRWVMFRSPILVFIVATLVVVLMVAPEQAFVLYIGIIAAYIVLWYLYNRTLLRLWDSQRTGIQRLVNLLPKGISVRNARAIRLLQRGQLIDAERMFRDLLSRRSRSLAIHGGVLLNNLGYCLTLNDCFEEALPILEAAIRVEPGFGNGYDNLGEWYLSQNLDAERALELCEVAVEITPALSKDSRAIQQATYARTLALTGQAARAEAALQQALGHVDCLRSPTAAEVHRQIGYVGLAFGDHQAAQSHFARAVELDPHGLHGKLAQRALEALASHPGC